MTSATETAVITPGRARLRNRLLAGAFTLALIAVLAWQVIARSEIKLASGYSFLGRESASSAYFAVIDLCAPHWPQKIDSLEVADFTGQGVESVELKVRSGSWQTGAQMAGSIEKLDSDFSSDTDIEVRKCGRVHLTEVALILHRTSPTETSYVNSVTLRYHRWISRTIVVDSLYGVCGQEAQPALEDCATMRNR